MTDFQKRHYVAIAAMISESADLAEFEQKITRYFKADNPKFDSERFLKACHTPDED